MMLWGGLCRECHGRRWTVTCSTKHRCGECNGTGAHTPDPTGWHIEQAQTMSGEIVQHIWHDDIDDVAWRLYPDDSCETITKEEAGQ